MTRAVPKLAVAAAPVLEPESRFVDEQPHVKRWRRHQRALTTAPFRASVDLRKPGSRLSIAGSRSFATALHMKDAA